MSSRTRPATIAELAEEALDNPWDPSKDLKHYLKQAERFRRAGKDFTSTGDLESAFVQFAKAATLVLEKIPTHKDYHTILSKQQRSNLALNGQDILDSLSELKPVLLRRHEQWASRHPNDTTTPNGRGRHPPVPSQPSSDQDNRRMVAEEVYRWKQQREAAFPLPDHRQEVPQATANPHRDAAMLAARKAASVASSSAQASRYQEQQQQHEMRRKQEELARRQQEPQHRHADDAARAIQHRLGGGNGIVTSSSSPAIYQMPAAQPAGPPVSRPAPAPYYQRSYSNTSAQDVPNLIMPLERPGYDGDSTDSESVANGQTGYRRPYDHSRTPIRDLSARMEELRTTTSPGPEPTVEYPKIMSQHQKSQGYIPSRIFDPSSGHTANPSTLLFQDKGKSLYSSDMLPSASAPYRPSHGMPQTFHYNQPRPQDPHPSTSHTRPTIQPSSSTPDSPPRPGELKTVHLPRECLSRFLAIASINTSRNKETCGLLLGKAKGHKFVVSTLLVPKQHSTSDTCTMDEEELVLQFTEERSLITLGWIHTHPSQSCFMSSVDLHTHSGFQRMLPESFAVVCAPKSDPSVGIFRLTDPPGLETILACNAQESFHPHPDVPIYTDADRGHVQMKDIPLEIVDIRK